MTMFTEPGPVVTAAEWAAFRDGYAALARDAAAVVLSGSLPPGVPRTPTPCSPGWPPAR
ncbi:hypothetical protein [Actinomadura madurae]|uniref:hypothetical protein n=1 Tax=Actinomadura madurae TaxID=1993 RepID=UPI0020D25AF8|nr:hypothetical protein [Actinomadura madurae]MCQ0010820.1 hypothetical protein [Actinomadura madurae]